MANVACVAVLKWSERNVRSVGLLLLRTLFPRGLKDELFEIKTGVVELSFPKYADDDLGVKSLLESLGELARMTNSSC